MNSFARVFAAQPSLPMAQLVSVETDISNGLHAFTMVGLPDKAVEEARDRVASAIKNSDFTSPKSANKKIVVSLAPAELKKEGSMFDLPVALSYLVAAGEVSFKPDNKLFAGELTLDGRIRSIRGALSIALLARAQGIQELYIPADNIVEASLVSGITLYGIEHLKQLIAHLHGLVSLPILSAVKNRPVQSVDTYGISLADIRGQESAKRGLEIAAAGRHNVALYGPPGTGKTMLARAAAALLPPLSQSEIIEVTSIHSLAGMVSGAIMNAPPFRAPHHTASHPSIIGGGPVPQPGEVTLAHRGILFLDEFPEFHRDVINALREPLEDGQVSIVRARGKALFPANFMLMAALNPCPCGYYGTPRCHCSSFSIDRYKRKISGPIADRIDMWVHVDEVPPEALGGTRTTAAAYETVLVRERVRAAHAVQRERFREVSYVRANADMRPPEIELYAHVSEPAEATLIAAARSLKLSARGYHRTIKLARTIADIDTSTTIETSHMLEALQYRVREF